jgi:hypothetical protein
MRVIGKRVSMETPQGTFVIKRRSFFTRLLGTIAGGWMAGNLFSGILRATAGVRNSEEVKVRINPLAVSRAKKEPKTHGT